MGCWNKTCGVTQFPIVAGDETVNFILVENEFGSDNRPCYPNGHGWNIIPLPFYGQYDDYGWQDDHDGQQSKYDFLAKWYKDRLIEVEEEKSRAATCYPKMSGPFESSESLGNSIHGDVWRIENRMSDRFGGPKSRRLGTFMISRIVWDKLTSGCHLTYPEEKWLSHAEITQSVNDYLAYLREKKAEDAVANDDGHDELTTITIQVGRKFAIQHAATQYIQQKFNGRGYFNPLAGVVNFLGYRDTTSDPNDISMCSMLEAGVVTPEDVASVYLWQTAMYTLRKGYFPQSGEGSQEGVEHTHTVLIEAMQAMLEHDKKRYGDDEE